MLSILVVAVIVAVVVAVVTAGRARPAIPLRYIPQTGLYVARVRLGGSRPMDCVVDTGSRYLNVIEAVEPPGTWHADPDESGPVTIRYGTQRGDVDWYTAPLRIGDAKLPPVRFALTREVDCDSRVACFNVLGLNDRHGSLLRQLGVRRFSLTLAADGGGELALDCAAVAPVMLPVHRNLPCWGVGLAAVTVGGRPVDCAASVLLVDSGSNMLGVESAGPLREALAQGGDLCFHLVHGTRVVKFRPPITENVLIDDGHAPNGAVVLGSLLMRGTTFFFDCEAHTLGFVQH